MTPLKFGTSLRKVASGTNLNSEGRRTSSGARKPMGNNQADIDVLVVDDDPEFAEYVVAVASEIGLHPEFVVDPTQFATRCEALRPRIVVLDIEMPAISGLQLAQWLGEFSRSSDIDIRLIVLSGRGEEVIRLCQSVGAISGLRDIVALAKPVEFTVLAEAFRGQRAA